MCPACGTLVGATANRCHQCGASMTFSIAAASRSLRRLCGHFPGHLRDSHSQLPALRRQPAATIQLGGMANGGGSLGGFMNLGGISVGVLIWLELHSFLRPTGALEIHTAVFLHGSLIHIGFNMWVLMDFGPQVEEIYGSARYFFIYVFTGAFGFVFSSRIGHFSVGGSGGLMGLIGMLMAVSYRRGGSIAHAMRGQLIIFIIFIFMMGFRLGGMDNAAHLGGLVSGFLLGR